MSGIEIAGLILGAFPLLIAALEKHKEAAVALGDWWKIRQIYQECIRLINCERTLFDQNLRGLLGPVLYDHSTLDELVTDPFGEQWRSESLAASLEDLLPTSHEIYIGIIKDFHRYMMAIGLELGLENQHFQRRMNANDPSLSKGRGDLRDTLGFEWERVRFAFNRNRRQTLIAGLSTCNSYLDRFLASNDRMESPLPPRANKKVAMPRSLGHFWQHAKALDPHKIEFKVLFTFAEKLTCQHSGPWDWKEAKITALEERAPQPKASHDKAMFQALSGRSPAPSSALRSLGQKQKKQKQKEVAFLENIVPGANVTALLPLQVYPSLPEITDLCAKLASTAPDDTELGMIAKDSMRFSITLPEQKPLTKSTLEHITLDEVLRVQGQKFLSRRQRYNIALAIASAYVQLHASPWILADWNRCDIYLLWDSGTSQFREQPRISRNIPSQPQSLGGKLDQSLVKLGIMLLELAFGQVLEQNPLRQQWPSSNDEANVFLDKAAAEQWCERYAPEEHPHFEDPVMWCLRQPMTRTKRAHDDDTWRKDLFSNVVHPLEVCCKQNNFEIQET